MSEFIQFVLKFLGVFLGVLGAGMVLILFRMLGGEWTHVMFSGIWSALLGGGSWLCFWARKKIQAR